MQERKLASWLDAFIDYTDGRDIPLVFQRWAGIATIAGALERKVWVVARPPDPLYPNLYTTLIAPPGVGKTFIIKTVRELWKGLKNHHVAKSAMSRASLVDSLREAKRQKVVNNNTKVIQFESLLIASNELTVLLPAYDADFMGTLTDLYDCHPYGEKKRTSDLDYEMDSPQLNILAGTTPSYLNNLMPEGAWDQGFVSRLFMVYAGSTPPSDLFVVNGASVNALNDLIHDLNMIGDLYGELKFTVEAAQAINAWHKAGGPPRPDHPRLQHYNTRRTAHMLKLCMVACVSSGQKLVITEEHFTLAKQWLLDMESRIPDIFKAMSSGGDMKVINDAWHFLYKLYAKEGKPIREARLIRFISERSPSNAVERLVQIMAKIGAIKETWPDKDSGKCFVPLEPPKE